jgi:hypothetical protein
LGKNVDLVTVNALKPGGHGREMRTMHPLSRPNRDKVLEQVYQIAKDHLQGMNVHLYLFGSWARGEERRSSDIDLALDYETPLPTYLLARLREALEESTVPYRVEVVDLTQMDENFKERVRREGIEWEV